MTADVFQSKTETYVVSPFYSLSGREGKTQTLRTAVKESVDDFILSINKMEI